MLVLGIVRTDVERLGLAQTLGVMAIGVALLAAFLAIEGRFAERR